jgi:asparagine synthase (glutamine-hydrolysing)
MCGFAGIVSNQSVSDSLLESFARTIIHRGPDHTGYFKDDNVGFVHNRLSLVDLSTNAHQPFMDETHVLLFNGEIYNHQKLRTSMLSSQAFRSTSDTETLFYLLKHYGVEKASNAIHGMFAFAWMDRNTKEICLVRDRIGIKPLFYFQGPGEFVFSSELKLITTHFDIKPNKATTMSAALGELEFSRTATAFESMSQLEPGAILRLNALGNVVSVSHYFKITDLVDRPYYEELHRMDQNSLLGEFDRLFSSSVSSMLMSDVGMGAFVSGGIDSSLIASVASKDQRIDMFTANVVGKYSELPFSKLLAESIGQPLHVYDFEPENLIRDLVETTWYYEAPIVVHSNAIPFQGVAKLARNSGVKAVMTGEGSDELFLGYPRLLTRKWDGLINLPYNLTTGLYKKIPGLTRYLNLNKNNYNRDLLYMPFGFERQSMMASYQEAFDFVGNAKMKADHILTIEMLGRSLHALLWRNDRMGMMHSIESRFPFLDEDLMRFAMNAPIGIKIGKTHRFHNYKHPFLIDKFIVRKYAEKYLPDSLNYREKKGFPLFGLLNMEIKKGFFKGGFLQELMQYNNRAVDMLERDTERYLLAKLACVEVWGRLFIQKEPLETVKSRALEYLHINAA